MDTFPHDKKSSGVWRAPSFFAIPILIYFQDQKNREQLEELAFDLYRKVIERPEFMLDVLSIEGASDSLNAEIREVLGLHFPVSYFDLNFADLRKRVLALPPLS